MQIRTNSGVDRELKTASRENDLSTVRDLGGFELTTTGKIKELLTTAFHSNSTDVYSALIDYAANDLPDKSPNYNPAYFFGKVLDDVLRRRMLSDVCSLKPLLDQQPHLSETAIADLIDRGYGPDVLTIVDKLNLDEIRSGEDHRDQKAAFEAVMLKTVSRATGYKKGQPSDFFATVRDLVDGDYTNVIQRVHEIGDLSDKQLMRYAIALAPTSEAVRRAYELTETPLVVEEEKFSMTRTNHHLKGEFLEALRRGHDGGVQFYSSERPVSLSEKQFRNALKTNPNLDNTDDEYEDYRTGPVSEQTARQLLEQYGTINDEAILRTIVSDYSADFISEALSYYEGGKIRRQRLGDAGLDKITYVARNVPMKQSYYCLENHLQNLDSESERRDAVEQFVDACSPDEKRELIVEAAENGYMTVLNHAGHAIDMDQFVNETEYTLNWDESDDEYTYLSDDTPETLKHFAFARALSRGHVDIIDAHYPDWGTLQDVHERTIEGLSSSRVVDAVVERLDERGQEQEIEHLRRTLGEQAIDDALSGRDADWAGARTLVEYDFELPGDASSIAYRAFRDDHHDLFDLFRERNDGIINSDIFYEATLHKTEEDLQVIADHYDPDRSTLVRAVNKIITQTTNDMDFNEKKQRLQRLDDRFDIDYNYSPSRGSGELSYAPLRTVVGFPKRDKEDRREKERCGGYRYEGIDRWIEVLVDLGADPDRPELMEVALRSGSQGVVRELLKAGFQSADRIDGSVLKNAVSDEAVFEFFEGTDYKKRNQNETIQQALIDIVKMDNDEKADKLRGLLNGDIDLESEESARVRDALIQSVADGTENWAIASVFLNELMREQPGSLPPPPQQLMSDIEDTPVYDIVLRHLRSRQANMIEMRKAEPQSS